MKVIDLLNKIANGEELPNKIYYFNREFYLKENTYFGDTFTLMHYIQEEDLNDEVEIIEEDKKTLEKLELIENGGFVDIPQNKELMDKINEIIDYIKENK